MASYGIILEQRIAMMTKLILLIFLLSFSLSGCAWIKNADQLLILKGIGDSQDAIERDMTKQEKLFKLLLDDINSEELKEGTPRKHIIKRYGQPIIISEAESLSSIKEILLYRHPTNYFSSDKVYLYFDLKDKLDYWKYKPAQ